MLDDAAPRSGKLIGSKDAEATAHRLLAEQGVYAPIELLIETNGLAYDDCRAWRTGNRRTLDDALVGGTERTRRLLEELDAWAQSFALQGELTAVHGVEEHSGSELTASNDTVLDVLLRTEYRPKSDRQQKDLFLDTRDMQAANALIRAIRSRNVAVARAQLATLQQLNAEHRKLPSGAVLVEAIAEPSPVERGDALRQMDALERRWLPAASTMLGSGVRDFAVPLWRSIAEVLDDGTPFRSSSPKEHASFPYWKGLDWQNVRRSVLGVPSYRTEPPLLEPLAEAEWRTRNRQQALAHWFTLSWLAPERFAAAARSGRIGDRALCGHWEQLQDQDWAEPVTAAWLPAWTLLREPSLTRTCKPTDGADAPKQAFDLLLILIARDTSPRTDVENRRKLQRLHPSLFQNYLASVDG